MKNLNLKQTALLIAGLLISLQASAGVTAVICGDIGSSPAAAVSSLNQKTIFAENVMVKSATELTLLGNTTGVENFQVISLPNGDYQACGTVKSSQ